MLKIKRVHRYICCEMLIMMKYYKQSLDCFGEVFYHVAWFLGFLSNMVFQEKKGTSCFGSVCISIFLYIDHLIFILN